MSRILLISMTLLPVAALAHEGGHHHPHGIEFGWIIAAAVGVIGGLGLAAVRNRRK